VSKRTSPIAVAPAVGTWATAWVVGGVLATPLALAASGASLGDDLTVPQLAVAAGVAWAVFVAGLVVASRRFGTGVFVGDYAVAIRPSDAWAIPLGVVTQVVLVPVSYLPLRGIWPDTFSSERLEQRAQDLADKAGGFDTVLLVLVVVVGAPVIEELVYRALVQGSLTSRLGGRLGLPLAALLFALVHFSPVEYPGLFLAGLVFGGCFLVTGRIGTAVVAHAAFNLTGLVMVLRR
jgi:membrane protease YdiL (CAAX protease family)